jgi:hypothetical protein
MAEGALHAIRGRLVRAPDLVGEEMRPAKPPPSLSHCGVPLF